MDLLTGTSPSHTLQVSTGLLSSNLMSFTSPPPPVAASHTNNIMLKPEMLKPCNLEVVNLLSSPLNEDLEPQTSTPFEGDLSVAKFTFESNLEGISEDPFDLIERQANQDSTDPFEMVSAEAENAPRPPSFSETLGSKGSLLNIAFGETGSDSSTGLTADFAKLNVLSGGLSDNSSAEQKSDKETLGTEDKSPGPKKVIDDEIWLQNEIPPWEGEEVPDDLSVDDSDGENDLIDVVRRVSSDFPKMVSSITEELDTQIVKNLKLKSPLLQEVPEFDMSPTAEPLEVPNIGLRPVDLSFMDTETVVSKSPVKTQDEDNLAEWKRQIMEKASGFTKAKKQPVSAKPFSQPLGSFDLNSPASSLKVSTPVRSSPAPKSNLPTPKFTSRLMKPRSYGINKENQ